MSVSVMTRLAARLLGTAGAEGGPGSGRTPARPHMEPWRGTSVQVCGLWPLIVGGVPQIGRAHV